MKFVSVSNNNRSSEYLPFTQYGHNTCPLFKCPQAEHLFNDVTSFSPLPAICLCLFFMCDVFFFGTARRIDSHKPSINPGILRCIAKGSDSANEGSTGRDNWRAKRVENFVECKVFGAVSRGRKEDRMERVVT